MKKYKFDCIVFNNRRKFNKILRNCNWVIFGLRKEWFDPNSYSYTIALFGLDLSIWFKRKRS